jgi:hypothetical protein
MNIELNRISTDFVGERCYVHARGLILPSGFGIITTQKLELSGCDVFYGIEMMKSADGGKTFSAPSLCKNLCRRYFPDGTSLVMSDATPFYHKASGKIILTGHMVWYGTDNKILREARPRSPLYAVYNEKTGDFDAFREIEIPGADNDEYFSCGAGCSQIVECENGDLLIPVHYKPLAIAADPRGCSTATVVRCSFDGENMKIVDIGNTLKTDIPRGIDEPSIIKFGKRYFLAIRNDQTGLISRSDDGLHFGQPRELCFDDGENLGNYNTQQHWLTGGGKLWLVYTRKAGFNDHIFRHRAPLFIAEVDPDTLRVIRSTEKIAVPERGARLGNFGCQSYSDTIGYVFAAEWMQHGHDGWEYCAKYGSDNSIFISKITY